MSCTKSELYQLIGISDSGFKIVLRTVHPDLNLETFAREEETIAHYYNNLSYPPVALRKVRTFTFPLAVSCVWEDGSRSNGLTLFAIPDTIEPSRPGQLDSCFWNVSFMDLTTHIAGSLGW